MTYYQYDIPGIWRYLFLITSPHALGYAHVILHTYMQHIPVEKE